MERLYRVVFDTQKDRQYITWGIFIISHNKTDAASRAIGLWRNKDNPHQRTRKYDHYNGFEWFDHPHMFHINAARMDENERDHNVDEFFIIGKKAVTWGYQGYKESY